MTGDPLHWSGALPILTAAQMRAAELDAVTQGTSLAVLMDRAGTALADLVWRAAAGRNILIMVGPGNNGGDGYVAARILTQRGASVRVAALAPPQSELAVAAASAWQGPVEQLSPDTPAAPVLVDALFGTGGRPLDAADYALANPLAKAASLVVAVDIPSGLDADSGCANGNVIPANVTLALGALKPAHRLYPAAALCGTVRLAGIGIATETRVASLGQVKLDLPGFAAHKYARGMVAVVAGPMTGAAELAARSALRSGAGYVSLLGSRCPPGPPYAIVRGAMPDAEGWDERIGAIVVGPGLGKGENALAAFASVIASGKPMVVDADALSMIAAGTLSAPTILTPHAGEFARLRSQAFDNKLTDTVMAAAHFGAVIIHKGADTVIASPDGRAVIAGPASSWLSTAGTGDVLAGVCAAMLARGLDPFSAACAGVALHGEAARRAGPGLCADDLVAGPIWP